MATLLTNLSESQNKMNRQEYETEIWKRESGHDDTMVE